jgi:peptidoglycan/xylan/chitin deacetylase (PgdA/CDA1 family)
MAPLTCGLPAHQRIRARPLLAVYHADLLQDTPRLAATGQAVLGSEIVCCGEKNAMNAKKAIIRTGLETLYFSGAHMLMQPFVGGVGAILMLHHVRPARNDRFQPNRLLEITPQFLERVIRHLRRSGVDLISLDEMHRRLSERDFGRRFACITFDDGYCDNKQWAYPILKAEAVPFAIYVPTSFPERVGQLWWLALEEVIARNDQIAVVIGGEERRIDCASVNSKREAFEALHWWLRERPTEDEILGFVRDLATRYDVDMSGFCAKLCMTWSEIREIAADLLATIGAHTVNHVMLSKASDEVVRSELEVGRSVLEAALGAAPVHLAYPYGDRDMVCQREFRIAAELGYKTAVTTRPGVLFPTHAEHLTALPRLSINGEYQQSRYLRVLMSGAATAVWNGFRRVDAA